MPSNQGDAEDLPAFRCHKPGKPADIALGLRAIILRKGQGDRAARRTVPCTGFRLAQSNAGNLGIGIGNPRDDKLFDGDRKSEYGATHDERGMRPRKVRELASPRNIAHRIDAPVGRPE